MKKTTNFEYIKKYMSLDDFMDLLLGNIDICNVCSEGDLCDSKPDEYCMDEIALWLGKEKVFDPFRRL